QKERPQLVVLDVMLPGIDGIELLRRMRASSTLKDLPVIMATAKGQEFDKIKTLDMGADDYLVKPFSVLELVSRVKAVLRRTEPDRLADVFTHGDLVVNFDEYT
ncbi:response regulator, partial [Streptococcus anginosus]|nr:response regulator [Streptococcus anginosus]